MYQKERLESILALLEQHGYMTVRALTEELHYSTATINRDLNLLQKMKRVHRTYGGVEPIKKRGVPLRFRYEKDKTVKKRISRAAAALVEEGDTLFIDASTTAEYMGPYLLEKKGLTVITNNNALAEFLADAGVTVIILGGRIVEVPTMTDGEATVEQLQRYRADKCFFSTGGFTANGEVLSGPIYCSLHRAMLRGAAQSYFLADRTKLGRLGTHCICDFSALTGVISDVDFSPEVRAAYPDTAFLTVKSEPST